MVSGLYYDNLLVTPDTVAGKRQQQESSPLVWCEVCGTEVDRERSYANKEEADVCVEVCMAIREQAEPRATIALLTFYKGQHDLLLEKIPGDERIDVLTVDACQGSEYDYVVLSTVRSNPKGMLGFVCSGQRICVCISRAKLKLVIVGNRQAMAKDAAWSEVQMACQIRGDGELVPMIPRNQRGTFVMLVTAAVTLHSKTAAGCAAGVACELVLCARDRARKWRVERR